jgi:RHS repeat-associated protein
LWSGNQVIAEFQALVGTTFNPGTTPEQAAGTDTLADLRYQHTDIRSVRLITDGTGLQVDTQAHTPHGGVVDGGGQARTFFTTYEREMSGLDYARARYYRSNHRRFTSADPYGGSYRQGNPQSLNRYAYVANDPTNRVDPSGAVATLVESAMDLEKGELHASVMSVEQDRCNLDEIRRAAQKAKELYPNHACYAMIETIKFAFLECGRNRIDQAMLYLLGTFTGPNAVPFGQIGFQRKFWDSNFPDNPTIDQVHHFIAWFYFGFTSNPVVKSLGFRNLLNDITERNAGDIRLSGYGSYYGLLLRSLVNNPNATQSDIYDLVFKIQETLCAGD